MNGQTHIEFLLLFSIILIFGYPKIRMSRYPDIPVSGYPDIHIRISEYSGIWTSGCPDIRTSRCPDVWMSRYPMSQDRTVWLLRDNGDFQTLTHVSRLKSAIHTNAANSKNAAGKISKDPKIRNSRNPESEFVHLQSSENHSVLIGNRIDYQSVRAAIIPLIIFPSAYTNFLSHCKHDNAVLIVCNE